MSDEQRIVEAALDRQQPHPTPESIIANVLADGRTAGADGIPRVGRATRKKAHEIADALRRHGWRILR